MDTVLHYLSTRMDYNKKLQKATHLVVDEAQVVSEKPGSADMLNNAVITFRKFGGIVTLAMQNVVAALANKKMVELFQNCSYKCFLDQGGVDAQSLAEIQPLSEREFRALGTGKPGEGVIVWNKKVVLFNARIEKDNILYEKYSTNFHEKAQRKAECSSVMAVPVRKENVTKSEEEPELWEERVPLQVAYKPEPEIPQNWQEESPDVLQQGWGGTGVGDRAAAGSVCPHPAGRCDRTVRDCTTGCTAVVGYHGSGKGVGRERGLVSDKVGEINEIK